MMSLLLGMIDPWVAHPRDIADLAPTDKIRVLQGETVSVDAVKQLITLKLSWKAAWEREASRNPCPCVHAWVGTAAGSAIQVLCSGQMYFG